MGDNLAVSREEHRWSPSRAQKGTEKEVPHLGHTLQGTRNTASSCKFYTFFRHIMYY